MYAPRGKRCVPVTSIRMTLAMEETEPVASEDGWTMTVHVNKIDTSPGGTRKVLQSESYNFRRGADVESDEMRTKRLEVKRKSRMRAFDKFDEAKREANKAKRRKPARQAAETIRPAATAIVAAGFATPTLPVAVPTAVADAGEPPDVATQREIGRCYVRSSCCRRRTQCLTLCVRRDWMMRMSPGRCSVCRSGTIFCAGACVMRLG